MWAFLESVCRCGGCGTRVAAAMGVTAVVVVAVVVVVHEQ